MKFDSTELGLLLLTDPSLTPEMVLNRDNFTKYLDGVIDPVHEFWSPATFPGSNELRQGLKDPKYAEMVIDDCKGEIKTVRIFEKLQKKKKKIFPGPEYQPQIKTNIKSLKRFELHHRWKTLGSL